eukprot:g15335.t1
MGRFAEESHTDLREWYVHCLDFRALKRRLVDDPPDPYDDHPSLMGPSPASPSAAGVGAIGGSGRGGASVAAVDADLEQHQALLMGGQGGGALEAGEASRVGGDVLWGNANAGRGGISLAFPDPASRVFVFEINEELERMWAFYRAQSDECASKLASLHDASADLRHQLHRKLGAAAGGDVGDPSTSSILDHRASAGDGEAPGGSGGRGDYPPASPTAMTTSLLDDPSLQYTSPVVVSTGSVLRPTHQEHLLVSGSAGGSAGGGGGGVASAGGGSTRIRGRKSASNLLGASSSQLQGEDAASSSSGWRSPATTPKHSSSPPSGGSGGDDVDGGMAKANALGAGRGSGNGDGDDDGGEAEGAGTTEDPYVQASLKRSIVELYDTCHRLLSFKMLNYDAFVRLIELHSRRSEASSTHGGMRRGSSSSFAGSWSSKLAAVTDGGEAGGGAELLYASLFCNGDVDVARTALTFKASSSLRGNRRFDFGYRLGAACVLLAWALWDCIADDSLGKDVWHDPAFKIYRGLGNLVLLVYMWGVNIWVWRRFGIDYERCLSLDPKGPRIDPCEQVWNTGCNLSIAFLVSFICFYKCLRGVLLNPKLVPIQFAHIFPLLLLLFMLYCFLTPWSERKELLRVLWTTVISPFGQVRFLEGYVGDILTSVVRVLVDLAFAFLYFLSGVRGWLGNSLDLAHDPISSDHWFKNLLVPLLMVAPLWWRFQQNLRRSYETRQRWPHLGNALKYATAMSVSLFGTFQPQMKSSWVWVFCFVYATLYQFTWDVVMDWDLLRWDGKSLRLRPRLLYRSKTLYAGVAVTNLLLRFLWTVTLVPENAPNLFPHDFQIYLSPFIAAAEIVRRTMWGFIRVENEHLRIYGAPDGTADSDDGDAGSAGFKRLPSSGSSVSTMAGSSINSIGSISSSGPPSGSGGGGGGGRVSGLDRLPYSRMDMSSSASGGGGLFRRATGPLKAWCLTRVKRESRCRLLAELCLFSALLVSIGFLAGLS